MVLAMKCDVGVSENGTSRSTGGRHGTFAERSVGAWGAKWNFPHFTRCEHCYKQGARALIFPRLTHECILEMVFHLGDVLRVAFKADQGAAGIHGRAPHPRHRFLRLGGPRCTATRTICLGSGLVRSDGMVASFASLVAVATTASHSQQSAPAAMTFVS
jgi:hypothetical protein